jgi:hypothetical protein
VSLDLTAIDKHYKSAGMLDPLGNDRDSAVLLSDKIKDQQKQSTAATCFDAFPQHLHWALNDLRQSGIAQRVAMVSSLRDDIHYRLPRLSNLTNINDRSVYT